jgi:hypothetical protein
MSKIVIYKDRGFAEILSRVAAAGSTRVRVGVLPEDAEKTHPLRDNISIGAVALMNEFGSVRAGVPERSFIRSTAHRIQGEMPARMVEAARRVVFEKESAAVALDLPGAVFAEEIRHTINEGVEPENADATVDEKGHDHTLIHTRTLIDSISHDVVHGYTPTGENLETAIDDAVEGNEG